MFLYKIILYEMYLFFSKKNRFLSVPQRYSSLLNCVPNVLACLRACMFGVLGVRWCLRAHVLTCLACLRARVFGVLTCLRDHVFSMLVCFITLRAQMPYMLTVFKYLRCLHAWVLLWHRLSCFLSI